MESHELGSMIQTLDGAATKNARYALLYGATPQEAFRRIELIARCMKCGESRRFRAEGYVDYKNGRRAVRGTCPVCRKKMSRIIGKTPVQVPASSKDL